MKTAFMKKSILMFLLGSSVFTCTSLANAANTRTEHDFLGEIEVPANAYYGVQTMRAMENFTITEQKLDKDFITAMAMVKKAACLANMDTGRMPVDIGNALVRACDEIIAGKMLDQFPIDPIQGGAGTSCNMNINEVITNRALEILGYGKGRYDIVSPNNHANMAQSTNDFFPTSIKVCLVNKSQKLVTALNNLADGLDVKAKEFDKILKMGRTHLQDAIPMTLGQEMAAYASAVRRATNRIQHSAEGLHAVNMGATAIGTGLNAEPKYIKYVVKEISKITGTKYTTAENLIDATNNTDCFADISGSLKSTALVLIKMANDFRMMASGPRCGLNEIQLPPRQPGSSIMPGKVNPVMAEVLNQTCYQVIGNDLTVAYGVENGQFELNVMEPVIAFNLFNSMKYLTNAINNFNNYLLKDLKANEAQCKYWLDRSVGIITALLPHIGYENCSMLAKEAYATGRPIKEIILEKKLLSAKDLERILSPEEMTHPGIAAADLLKKK